MRQNKNSGGVASGPSIKQASSLHQSYALRFVDSLATATLAFSLPLMVYGITHNVAWSGASFMLEWFPRLVTIPIAGPTIDYIGPTQFFVFADSVRAAILGIAAIYLLHNPKAWIFIVLTSVLTGMLAQATFVAAEKMGIEVTGAKPLHHVQAVQVGIDQVVQVLGPIVGGLLLLDGDAAVLFGTATLSAASIFFAARLRLHVAHSRPANRANVLSGFRTGLRVIVRIRSLLHVAIGTALFNLLLALLLTITPALIEQRFHRSASSISVAWGLAALASVITVGIASRIARRYRISTIGLVSALTACIACTMAMLTSNYWIYVGALMVFVAMDASYAVYIRTARAQLVPKAVYGTTVGIIVLLSLIPYPVAGGLVALIPFGHLTQLVLVSTGITAVLSIWSFLVMDHSVFQIPKVPALLDPTQRIQQSPSDSN